MLDIHLVRKEPEMVKQRLAARGTGVESMVDQILAVDQKRREVISEVERLKNERNTISKEVGGRKAKGLSADDLLSGMKEKSDRIAALDHELSGIETEQRNLLLITPNLPHPQCPVGADPSANPEVKQWGNKATFAFKPREHVELVESLGLIDFDSATKISGSGFLVYRGTGAKLERGLISFLLDLHTRDHSYVEVSPPFLVREACMEGTSQLPKFHEDMYRVAEENLYLAPTAEVPITNLHREEIVPHEKLPISYAAYSPCFRREAGSAGRETRGMIRVHQFDKVELVKIVDPKTSYEALEDIRSHAERVLELLGLHYRTIELCTGDISFGAAKCYDIEVWAPGAGAYLEVSSCSNFEEFQARRMNLRMKTAEGKNVFCHTLNGSGVALPRLVVALLETYQQEDGSVKLPEILWPYVGTNVLKTGS